MDENPKGMQEEPEHKDRTFRAVLTPHRSLSPRGFVILMSFVAAVSFVAGISFLMMGAWPVFGFFGLDALLIYVAFRLNYRSGRLMEAIEVTTEDLRLTRIHPGGRREEVALNPYWAQVHLAERPDGANRLFLRSHGKVHAVGNFLTDDERRELADTLKRALATARGG